jgi:hypothetical protein
MCSQGLVKKGKQGGHVCDAEAFIVIYPKVKFVPQVLPSHDEAMTILK